MIIKLFSILTTFLIINCSTSCAIAPLRQQPKFSNLKQMVILDRSSHNSKLQILLPLYIYPNWYDKQTYRWKQVIMAAKKVSIVAIINPNSGPNYAPPNVDYQQGIKDLQQVGIKIIGYVPTNYAKRDIRAVKVDIDLYTKYFNVDGIFLDEAASKQGESTYYQQVYQYIKSRSARYNVIINPGVDVDESYLSQPIADIIVTFENHQEAWANYHPPTYTRKYLPRHFAALVHTTANHKLMKSTLDRAVKSNFGYIYVTNDSIDSPNHNPWDNLPEYWQSEVNYIQKLNTAE
jgi:Spherulation-specific family 4